MLKVKNLFGLIIFSIIFFAVPAFAKESEDTVKSNLDLTVEAVMEHDLDEGTIKKINYMVDHNLTDTLDINANVSPFFLDPVDWVGEYPFSAIGLLSIDYEGGKGGYGTGFLVADNLVLTAAHNVQIYEEGYGNATKINFYAGFDYEGNCVASSKARAYYVSIGWTDSMSADYDWALLKLSTPIGSEAGTFPCKVESSLLNKNIMSIGYPSDPVFISDKGCTQGVSEGKVISDNGLLIRTLAEGNEGCSGGPIFDISDGNFTVVGVVSGGNIFDHIAGPKITTTVINLIRNYL